MKLIAQVTIEKYIRKIQTVQARRATYYKEGENLPIKYSKNLGKEYQWLFIKAKKARFLVDADGELVIKNHNSVGEPRYKIINGQDLHTLTLQDYERAKIVTAIKKQMIPEVEKLESITEYPLRILCELYDTYEDYEYLKKDGQPKKIDWDIDNRALMYCKTFADVLSGCPAIDEDTGLMVCKSKPIIVDDHRKYITQPPTPLFFPIDNPEERKLVFKIYKDDREIIKNSKHYD